MMLRCYISQACFAFVIFKVRKMIVMFVLFNFERTRTRYQQLLKHIFIYFQRCNLLFLKVLVIRQRSLVSIWFIVSPWIVLCFSLMWHINFVNLMAFYLLQLRMSFLIWNFDDMVVPFDVWNWIYYSVTVRLKFDFLKIWKIFLLIFAIIITFKLCLYVIDVKFRNYTANCFIVRAFS